MTIVEAALFATWPGVPEDLTFGYFQPSNGERVDDPSPIAKAVKKAGRHMSWADALPALEALGKMPAAPVTIHTTKGWKVLSHVGSGWHAGPLNYR